MNAATTTMAMILMVGSLQFGFANFNRAAAEVLRWTAASDSLTLDPQAFNEGPTHALSHQIYEPLVLRDPSGKIVPALAVKWQITSDANVWRFDLRKGVKFHDGADFTAEDVVFSYQRASLPTSQIKDYLVSIKEVRAVDDYTVEFVTKGPNPILPANFTNWFIMDKAWTEKQGIATFDNIKDGKESKALLVANGTGPYRVMSREADIRTVLEINPAYWGKGEFPLQVTKIIFTPIKNPATRTAALLAGEVDFAQDVPVEDLAKINDDGAMKIVSAPQNRVIFLGLNVGDKDLKTDNVDGKNPLADKGVRHAMAMAIDREAIHKVVMRGQSRPSGMLAPPFVNGWSAALDKPVTDVTKAQELIKQAGYQNGFSIRLNCPNDRYVNDAQICQALVGMLARVGIEVKLELLPKAQHFPKVSNLDSDFFMLGWGVTTFDSENVFSYLFHSRDGKYGSINSTRYINPQLDLKIQALSQEINLDKRNAMIAEIWQNVQDEMIYIPIHDQMLNWGMREEIDFEVQPEDQPKFKYMRM